MKIDLHPTKCNLCGSKVIYISNAIIYGKEYGSGKCYYCTACHAYVGTHKCRPKEAFGILSDEKMRNIKMLCHELFDRQWKNKSSLKERKAARREAYSNLAKLLDIPVEQCHFGYFDMDMLNKAYAVLSKTKNN